VHTKTFGEPAAESPPRRARPRLLPRTRCARLNSTPYDRSLLNLIVALEAVFLTSVVLLTQNHMTSVAERRARLELQVNLLAEQELTTMLHMLHALCTNAGVQVSVRNDRVQQLLTETDIQRIAIALDERLDAPAGP